MILARLKRGLSGAWGGRVMIRKSLIEELYIHIDKDELAKLLGADPGFSVQNVEEEKEEFRFMLVRKTALEKEVLSNAQGDTLTREQGERRRFL
jgi:hypothetical protein